VEIVSPENEDIREKNPVRLINTDEELCKCEIQVGGV